VGVTKPGRCPIFARAAAAVNPEFLGKTGKNSRSCVLHWAIRHAWRFVELLCSARKIVFLPAPT